MNTRFKTLSTISILLVLLAGLLQHASLAADPPEDQLISAFIDDPQIFKGGFVRLEGFSDIKPEEFSISVFFNPKAGRNLRNNILLTKYNGPLSPIEISWNDRKRKRKRNGLRVKLMTSQGKQKIFYHVNNPESRLYHWLISFSKANNGTLRIYQNGLEVLKQANLGADIIYPTKGKGNYYIATKPAKRKRRRKKHSFKGEVSDFRLYDRVLSDEEITALIGRRLVGAGLNPGLDPDIDLDPEPEPDPEPIDPLPANPDFNPGASGSAQILVKQGSSVINSGSLYEFGLVNGDISTAFTITNLGTASLELGDILGLPSNGFSLASTYSNKSLFPDTSREFTVLFSPDTANGGSQSTATSFTNNVPGSNPFILNLNGSSLIPTPPPPSFSHAIIDDGDNGYSLSGTWVQWGASGYKLDLDYASKHTAGPLDIATWEFTGLTSGKYKVSATWTPHANRATDAPYTIYDNGSSLATIDINQKSGPNDFSNGGVFWEELGTYTISSSILKVELSNDADGFVIADAIHIEYIPPGPEIVVKQASTEIADAGTYEFGSNISASTKTFTVENTGDTNLTLGSIGGLSVNGYTLDSNWGSTTVTPGGSTSFAVRYDPDTVNGGTQAASISFTNNDTDESPFNITLNGTASNTLVMDDGDADYSLIGSWTNYTSGGHTGDLDYVNKNTNGPLEVATWEFKNLPSGSYKVYATWLKHPNRATDAPYTIYDDTSSLATVDINQELDPNDLTADGSLWEDLGTYSISSGTLKVELSNDANQFVIADAIRIVKQ